MTGNKKYCCCLCLVLLCVVAVCLSLLPRKQKAESSFSWEYGRLAAQTGETPYVDRLLTSDKVYIGKNAAVSYRTYGMEDGEVAYVLAGAETPEGIRGSLWQVDCEGEVSLLKQQITVMEENPQYVTMEGVSYLALNYWEDGSLYGKLLPLNVGYEELLPQLSSGKQIGENAVIHCLSAAYTSCTKEQIEGEQSLVWEEGDSLLYDYIYQGNGRVKEVSAKEISREELEALPYGRDLLKQVAAAYPQGTEQYILRENGILNVNICQETEERADFYYMTFRVEEGRRRAALQESGEGAYLVSMTGNVAQEAFRKVFGETEYLLGLEASQLPWAEKTAWGREWSKQETEERGQSYLIGREYSPSAYEQELLQGVLPDWSLHWMDRPSYTDETSKEEWKEANKEIYVIQKTKSFTAYACYLDSAMLIEMQEGRLLLIDGYFTSNYGVQPQLSEQDFDGDGEAELGIIGLTNHGTGVCVDYLYMVDRSSDGKWYAYGIRPDWYEEQLMAHIASEYTEKGLELIFDGLPQGYYTDVAGDAASKHYAGSQISFSFEKQKILCRAELMIYSDTQFAGLADGSMLLMEIGYEGEGKWVENVCLYKPEESVVRP